MSTPPAAPFDEARTPDGAPRPGWDEVGAALAGLGPDGLGPVQAHLAQLLASDGVTTSPRQPGGAPEHRSTDARPWRMDPVPVVLDAGEWAHLERAVVQRSRLLDLVLRDLYGPQELVRRSLLPAEIVLGHPGYLRAVHGTIPPGAHQLTVHAVDVARGPDGAWMALADRAEAPSGIGYALADRGVLTRAWPELVRSVQPRRLGAFAEALRSALHSRAPEDVEVPRVVVLSPGAQSETAFDQAFLAALLGIPLVEGSDLQVHEGRVWLRSLGRREPVDVVLRRVDGPWCDPLELRGESRLGVVGLVEACRRGTVGVVNPLGSGVLENPALAALLPRLCEALLDEPLLLAPVPLFWCGRRPELTHVLDNLDDVVLRPLDGGPAVRPGLLGRTEREQWVARLRVQGWRWVGELGPAASVAPSAPAGSRGVVARLFSVGQDSGYTVMPGALGGVLATEAGHEPFRTRAAKDVWVRSSAAETAASRPAATSTTRTDPVRVRAAREAVTPPRVLADLYWLGRYAERVESTTRVLVATAARVSDVRRGTPDAAAAATDVLLGALRAQVGWGAEGGDPVVLLRELTGAGRPGSVAHAVARALQAAGGVRDQLSVDTWPVLAAAQRALAELSVAPVGDAAALGRAHAALLASALALSGLAAENMVRDPGWHLLDAGRRLERAQQLVALLGATLVPVGPPDGLHLPARPTEVLVLESVLEATESVLTHRRRHAGVLAPGAVLDLLLGDPGNPRSLLFSLQAVAVDLRALPDAGGTSRPARLRDDLEALVRRMDPHELVVAVPAGRPALQAELADIDARLRSLSDAVVAAHLRVPEPALQRAQYPGAGPVGP